MTDPSSQASGRVWRDAVRDAAAPHFPALRPVFLVSRCTDLAPDCAELEQQLGREHSQLGDILSPDLLDGHRRLGYKVRLTIFRIVYRSKIVSIVDLGRTGLGRHPLPRCALAGQD